MSFFKKDAGGAVYADFDRSGILDGTVADVPRVPTSADSGFKLRFRPVVGYAVYDRGPACRNLDRYYVSSVDEVPTPPYGWDGADLVRIPLFSNEDDAGLHAEQLSEVAEVIDS